VKNASLSDRGINSSGLVSKFNDTPVSKTVVCGTAQKAKKDIENLLIAGAQSRRRETLVIKSEARSDNQLFLS
jgi:hypothetical protein